MRSPRCPECGQLVRLSISLAEPYLKAWVALIAGLLPPAGIGGVMVFAFCYAVMREGLRGADFSRMPLSVAYLIAHVVLCIPGSIAVIVLRRRFLRLPKRVQFWAAFSAWALVVVSALVFTTQLR